MDENANDDADSLRLRQPLAVDADFRRCIELAPIGVCIADEQARILFANPQLCRQTGYSRDELLQLRVANFFPPEFQEQGRADFEQLVRTGSINVQQPFVSKTGERGWVSVSATKLKDGQFLGYISDISGLKEAQDDLQLKESAIANSISGVGIVDLKTAKLIYANESFLQIWGYERAEDALELSPLDFVRDREYGQAIIETVVETGRWIGELTAIKADGTFAEVEVLVSSMRDDHGEPAFMVGTFHDITNRKRAEASLQSSEEKLRQFIDQVPVGVAMLDDQMRYLACSRRWLSDARLGDRDITGESHYDLFPDVPSEIRECHARCLDGEPTKIDRITVTHPDGSTQHLRCEMHPWFAAPEKIGGIVLFSEDVTERYVAEQKLKASEQRLAVAQVIAHFGNWDCEIATGAIVWSDEVFRIFGHEPQSFTPNYERDFLQAIPVEDRSVVTDAVESAVRDRTPYRVTHRVIRPDGSERIVNEIGHPECDASGEPVRMIGVVHDVTEYRQAELQTEAMREQLAHASRVGTMGELAAGLAHELNQPLMAVHMYAQTAASLRKKSDGAAELGQKVDEALEKVAEQSLRAGEIVQRMRAFIGKRQPQLAECRVNDLVSDVLGLLHSPLNLGNINVQLELAESLPMVRADAIQMQQVLVNLIQNAIDAMSADGQRPRNLQLGTRLEGGDVVVSVADSGPGLPEAALLQVFDPFHSTKPAGMGLGLPICRTLVEAHGGTIVARANGDAGAVFEFRLPVLTKGTMNA